jgi:transcriptional regulator with XRE-family HTH domain
MQVQLSEIDEGTASGGRGASAVDVHVGLRIRMRRKALGHSQQSLADSLGLTFQQVQKYERGVNRVSASKLFDIARFLGVPVGFFFDGLPSDGAPDVDPGDGVEDRMQALLSSPQGLDLLLNFARIGDTRLRASILDLVRSAAAAGPHVEA